MDENNPTGRVLLIDDDRKFCKLIQEYLQSLGFTVQFVHTGPAGVEKALEGKWDAVILDVMLPGLGGFEVLKEIRKKSRVPILMLTSKGQERDRIEGLETGADDYLPKTFSTRELLARLRAVMRRSSAPPPSEEKKSSKIKVGPLRIFMDTRTATLDGAELDLTPVEFDLLAGLAQPAGKIKTREELVEGVRNRDFDAYDRSVDMHISSLRKKLGEDPKEPRFIKTVRTAGYILQPPAKER